MNLGKAIKLCRTQRGLTQTELSRTAGISVSYLSLLERNRRDPTLITVDGIAYALRVPAILLIYLASSKEDLDKLGPEICAKLSHIFVELGNNTYLRFEPPS